MAWAAARFAAHHARCTSRDLTRHRARRSLALPEAREQRRNAIADSRAIRTSTLLHRVTVTIVAGAEAAVDGMKDMDKLGVISVQDMHVHLHDTAA